MKSLQLYHDEGHIKGIRVTYYDGMYDLNSEKEYRLKPLHGSEDGSLSKVEHQFSSNQYILEINVGMGKQSIEALEFVMSNGERIKAGKTDSTMKRLPMEENTRIVALAGGFENGALKQISAHYFLLDERICIAE